MKFGDKIKILRKGKYTQEELADMLGIHVNTLLRWEHGERTPNLEKLKALANALSTTVEFLTDETVEPPKVESENNLESEKEQKIDDKIEMIHNPLINNDPSFVRELIKSTPMFIYENGKERFFIPATPAGFNFVKEMRDSRAVGNQAMAY